MTIQRKATGPDLLRLSEVAEMLRLGQGAVRAIPPSRLPFSRVSQRGDRRYAMRDVLAYIEAGRTDQDPADAR